MMEENRLLNVLTYITGKIDQIDAKLDRIHMVERRLDILEQRFDKHEQGELCGGLSDHGGTS